MRLYRQKKKICARMPVYCVLFRSKFSTVSGFMINCLLTEFGWAGRENFGSRSSSKDLAALLPFNQ